MLKSKGTPAITIADREMAEMSRKKKLDDLMEAITFAEAGEVETARAIATDVFRDEVDGNRARAATILGIDRVSLWRKLKRYGLSESES